MAYKETIALEHPDTCEVVELTVKFYHAKEELQTMDDPGADEVFEIESVEDQHGNFYFDELVWTDDQVIEGLKQC